MSGLLSICDCTSIVVDELPDSDAFRRAFAKARAGGFTGLRTALEMDDPDPRIFGSFVNVGPEVITLDRDGFRRAPAPMVEGNAGPPSRIETPYLSSLPASFEDTAAQIAKFTKLPPECFPPEQREG